MEVTISLYQESSCNHFFCHLILHFLHYFFFWYSCVSKIIPLERCAKSITYWSLASLLDHHWQLPLCLLLNFTTYLPISAEWQTDHNSWYVSICQTDDFMHTPNLLIFLDGLAAERCPINTKISATESRILGPCVNSKFSKVLSQ